MITMHADLHKPAVWHASNQDTAVSSTSVRARPGLAGSICTINVMITKTPKLTVVHVLSIEILVAQHDCLTGHVKINAAPTEKLMSITLDMYIYLYSYRAISRVATFTATARNCRVGGFREPCTVPVWHAWYVLAFASAWRLGNIDVRSGAL